MLAVFTALPVVSDARSDSSLENFGIYVEHALKQLNGVGLSVAVVTDGKVLYLAGHGTRQAGTSLPYTEHTVQNIGSISKTFTGDSLGILKADGKLQWDDQVIRHLPWFQMADPWITRNLIVRDLTSNRVGISGPDLSGMDYYLFDALYAQKDRRANMERFRYLEPAGIYRSGFEYGWTYDIAAQIVTEVSDQPWESFVQERLFAPLNMQRSSASAAAYGLSDDYARHHQEWNNKIVEIPIDYVTGRNQSRNSEGFVSSTASDMANWMIFHLSGGKDRGGQTLVPEELILELHALHTPYRTQRRHGDPELARFFDYRDSGSTLGTWHPVQYRGVRMLYKSGGNPGARARVAILPDAGIGVFVQQNSDYSELLWPVILEAIDRLLAPAERFDWLSYYRQAYHEYREAKSALYEEHSAVPRMSGQRRPARPLNEYTGIYHGDGAFDGTLVISRQETVLVAEIGFLRYRLMPFDADVFIADVDSPALGPDYLNGHPSQETRLTFVRFQRGENGAVNSLAFYNDVSTREFRMRPDADSDN